jgi:hypothetical protein
MQALKIHGYVTAAGSEQGAAAVIPRSRVLLEGSGADSALSTVCRVYASFFPWLVKGPSMGRMTWDPATLQYYCWAGRASWEADSDYTSTAEADSGYVPACHGGRCGVDVDLPCGP